MPSYFAQVFSNLMVPPAVKRNLDFSYRHIPMLNEVSTSLSSYLASQGQISRKKALMRWVKNTPELMAFLNKVTNDTVSKFHFEDLGKSSGRNKLLALNKFALNNNFRQLINQQFFDCLATGDGFGWMGKITNKQLKEIIHSKCMKAGYIEKKERQEAEEALYLEFKAEENIKTNFNMGLYLETKASHTLDVENQTQFYDEDVLAPKTYRNVPSSTVEVVYDRYDIKGYNHFLGVYLPMFFEPDEIIHYTLMKRDGKVNGFTPVESCIVQLELLRQMWQNQMALHKNGGTPDNAFILKTQSVSSPAFKNIQEQLQKYKLAENKHGQLVFTGEVDIKPLQQLDEMQFKDMGLYITGLVAMQWGIPRSSIPFIIGGTNTTNDVGGNSERGYWDVIEGFQDTFAEIMNTQLLIPYFGCKIVFDNTYAQYDIQMQQVLMSKIQNLQSMDALLMKNQQQLTLEYKQEVLGISDEDLEKADMSMLTDAMGLGTPKTSPDKGGTTESNNVSKAKKTEQQNTMASRGKPTGSGKEVYMEEAQDKTKTYEGFGAELPYNWGINKDNRVGNGSTPGHMLNNSNLDNPAGNLNYVGKIERDGTSPYAKNPDEEEQEEEDKKKKKLKYPSKQYPSQRDYPDEHTQFPGQDEKETQLQKGMKVEEEHADMYKFIKDTLKKTGKLPEWEDVKKKIAKSHIEEISNYYTLLNKMESAKETDFESIEYKSVMASDEDVVDLPTFSRLYQEDRASGDGKPPRVFMRNTHGIITLRYKSTDFVYKTQFAESEMENPSVAIMMMGLVDKLYRL